MWACFLERMGEHPFSHATLCCIYTIIIGNILATQRRKGENAFHMVFQGRWVLSNSSHNPALAATRLWAGYDDGENSISPGKPCEMHIIYVRAQGELESDALTTEQYFLSALNFDTRAQYQKLHSKCISFKLVRGAFFIQKTMLVQT